MSTSLDTANTLVAQLRAKLDGQLVTPEHPDYDDARTVFPGGFDRRPAAVARVTSSGDVSRVVKLVRGSGVPLAVRNGGHSVAGYGVCDDGIVLDVAGVRDLDVDVAQRTAWAGSGLTTGEYTTAVAEHGLVTGFGDTGSVGVAGITLGGGIGYLVRRFGLTIDQLLAAEIVTADGEVRQVDADMHPDLFWAIRGGGGNVGVVTRFKFQLHEVGSIVGGMLLLPATPDVVHGFVAAADAAPEELSTIVNVMKAPPMPFIPAEYHGQTVVMGLMCYSGPVEEGERVFAPFRALATPIADMVRPMRYPELFPPEQEGFHPTSASRTMFVDSVDEDRAALIVDRVQSSSAPIAATQLRVLGGAAARVPDDATAYGHRGRRIMANVAAMYQDPAQAAECEEWASGYAAELRDGDGAYVNFVGDEGEAGARAAYPGKTWDRLAEIKAKYDPTNLFRLNQNVPPAADVTS